MKYQQNAYTACSPVWMLTSTGKPGNFHEPAAFNAMLTDGTSSNPLVMHCPAYGGPFCIYPWYALGSSGFHYGVDFPDNVNDFGQADQFTQTPQWGGPFGPNTTYCSTVLK